MNSYFEVNINTLRQKKQQNGKKQGVLPSPPNMLILDQAQSPLLQLASTLKEEENNDMKKKQIFFMLDREVKTRRIPHDMELSLALPWFWTSTHGQETYFGCGALLGILFVVVL